MTTKYPPEADTIIVDPETGLPVLNESLDIDHVVGARCRGYCNRGRQPCKIPHVCGKRSTVHAALSPEIVWPPMRRWVDLLSHADDSALHSKPLSQPHELRMEIDRRVLRDICGILLLPIASVGAVYACYVIARCLAAGWRP
jgi:hypothetical protein